MPDADRGAVLGLPDLDRELVTCLPKGWLALVIGPSDAESSLFAKQFAHAGSGSVPAIYYTTYERTEDVKGTFRGVGWDPERVRIVNLSEEYFHRVLVRRLEVSKVRERGLKLSDLEGPPVEPPRNAPYNLENRILSDLSQLEGPFRLVIDSLDFLLEVLDLSEVMTVARQARHRAQKAGGQVLLVLHGEIHERRVSGLLEDMADVVVEISTRPDGARFNYYLTLRKVRNHPELKRMALLLTTEGGLALEPKRG